eukprot:PhF_6_TR10161/c0_g1_i1/m.15775
MRVQESTIIACSASAIWESLAKFDFSWWGIVQTCGLTREGSGIGVAVILTFKDKTVQKFRVVEMSELNRSITLELVESEPAIPTSGVIHTLRVAPVTKPPAGFAACCYVDWVTDFAYDASQEVLQDSRFKKLEAFGNLSTVFGSK